MLTGEADAKLLKEAREITVHVREAVRGKALWFPGVPVLQVLSQAAIVRQTECLESAVVLAEAGRGYAALPFVRPACEELLWFKYLVQLDPDDAEAVVNHSARRQMFESLRAQERFAGAEETAALGLAGVRERHEKAIEDRRSALRTLGIRLGWDKRTTSRGRLPTARFIAEKANELRLYDFIYGASSRHVHFNVPELMRRVWGRDGVYEVGSLAFSRYFGAFALGWCSHLLVRTVLEVEPVLPGTASRFRCALSAEQLAPPDLVPIVTAEEVAGGTHESTDAG